MSLYQTFYNYSLILYKCCTAFMNLIFPHYLNSVSWLHLIAQLGSYQLLSHREHAWLWICWQGSQEIVNLPSGWYFGNRFTVDNYPSPPPRSIVCFNTWRLELAARIEIWFFQRLRIPNSDSGDRTASPFTPAVHEKCLVDLANGYSFANLS